MTSKREQAIKKWLDTNRPDLSYAVHIAPAFDNEALNCLIAIGFEAGRDYQRDNPKDTLS